ncbi:two-component system response regulator [Spirochaetia bacterium]|nr:two-component system response regulator [Spirochaetia bacterium]
METERKLIVLVDDDLSNLRIGRNALSDAYEVYTVPSAEKLFELLKKYTPHLILLDIDMPGMDGYQAIGILKSHEETRDIPVIFLTGKSNPDNELKGLELGAIDYITKPFVSKLLNKRVELHLRLLEQDEKLRRFNGNLQVMVDEKTKNILDLQYSILKTVADLVERRDGDTGGHIMRTQRNLKILLDALIESGFYRDQIDPAWDLELITLSSQLHDVGKIAIDDSILRKPGKLDRDEFDEIKKHTTYGIEIIDRMMGNIPADNEFLKFAKIFVETHQEKWDGSGYPHGLTGEEIPLLGRVMAIADVYDALVSERPYKSAYTHEEAVRIILEGKGSHFDPVLVEMFEGISYEFKR